MLSIAASQSQAQPPPGAGPGMMKAMCPAEVPNTSIEATDTPGGIAITFTTTGDVAELQRRVHQMADEHSRRQHDKAAAPGGRGMGPLATMPVSTRTVDDLANGARITVKPDDASQLAAVRASVREHVKHMKMGHCGMGGAGAPAEPR